MEIKKVLTIAGSDASGGAGIQADIKTMLVHGVYAMSAVTALTAQNTLGVTDILETTPENLKAQLDAVFTDIFPDAVKVGMVSGKELIHVIAACFQRYHPANVVLDTVMVSTSGSKLLKEDAIQALKEELFPFVKVITPNIPEAEVLAERKIQTKKDMEEAAEDIGKKYQIAVLLKGGHLTETADDVLYQEGTFVWMTGERIDNPNTHGTGCTLSSAIASNLARGENLEDAVRDAKAYLSGALSAKLALGKGKGPLHHGYGLSSMSFS